jgi:hypothetical protein
MQEPIPMTDAEKLRLAVAEGTFVGHLADLGPILVAEIKRLQGENARVLRTAARRQKWIDNTRNMLDGYRRAWETERHLRLLAERAKDELTAHLTGRPVTEAARPKTLLNCHRCEADVWFNVDDLKPIHGWQFATDTGWLCPACQTPADHENFGTCPIDPRATRP